MIFYVKLIGLIALVAWASAALYGLRQISATLDEIRDLLKKGPQPPKGEGE